MSNRPCVENLSFAKVSLVFRSDALIPEEVTNIFGINPTWAHAKGEEAPKTKTPRSSGVWALEVEGQEVEVVVSELLELLKNPSKSYFDSQDNIRCVCINRGMVGTRGWPRRILASCAFGGGTGVFRKPCRLLFCIGI